MENLFEESINKELRSMDQRLYDLEEKMNSIDTKLSQVVDAILGNPLKSIIKKQQTIFGLPAS